MNFLQQFLTTNLSCEYFWWFELTCTDGFFKEYYALIRIIQLCNVVFFSYARQVYFPSLSRPWRLISPFTFCVLYFPFRSVGRYSTTKQACICFRSVQCATIILPAYDASSTSLRPPTTVVLRITQKKIYRVCSICELVHLTTMCYCSTRATFH